MQGKDVELDKVVLSINEARDCALAFFDERLTVLWNRLEEDDVEALDEEYFEANDDDKIELEELLKDIVRRKI